MGDDLVYALTLDDASGDGGGMAGELFSALELTYSTWEDKENPRLVHTVYCGDEAGRDGTAAQLCRILPEWRKLGAALADPQKLDIRREDWAEVWKKYFHVIEVSDRLFIKPSWLECEAKPGRVVVELDPGMSFGTGQHATTLFCLGVLDGEAKPGRHWSALDAGCGSGILTIAAAKLGYGPIDAFDYDPDAVMVAKENLEKNGIDGIAPTVDDAALYRGRAGGYDLVCANILGHLLKAYRHNIASWVKPGGMLALSGILTTEFDGVAAAFTELGFTEIRRGTLREWTGGLFRRESGK